MLLFFLPSSHCCHVSFILIVNLSHYFISSFSMRRLPSVSFFLVYSISKLSLFFHPIPMELWWIKNIYIHSDSMLKSHLCMCVGSIPGSGRIPWRGNGNLLQYSCLGNPMDRGVCQAIVHRVTKELDMTERARARAHTHTHTHAPSFREEQPDGVERLVGSWVQSWHHHCLALCFLICEMRGNLGVNLASPPSNLPHCRWGGWKDRDSCPFLKVRVFVCQAPVYGISQARML